MKVGVSLPIRELKAEIDVAARAAGREPDALGAEAGVAVVGAREGEWRERVAGWHAKGLSHLCLRTLGGGLDADRHMEVAGRAFADLPAMH